MGSRIPRFDRSGKRTAALLIPSICIHLLFLVSLTNGILDPLFNASSHRIGQGADFYQFYQAGRSLVQGMSIYQHIDPSSLPYGPSFRYPPLMACGVGLAFQPFTPETARLIWCIVSELFFLATVALLWRIAGSSRALPVAALCLMFTPLYTDLYLGQTNTLMALLIALIICFALRNRNALASSSLAVSINVKFNTLLLLPVLLIRENRRFLLRTLVLTGALFIPYFLFFPEDLFYFFEFIFRVPDDYLYQAGNLGSYPFIQEIVYLFTYDDGILRGIQALWSLSVLLLTVWIFLRSKNPDTLDVVSLFLCAYFLTFKYIWEHHLVMLLPVLTVEYIRNRRSVIVFLWILLALPTVFFFVDLDLGVGYTELQPYLSDGNSMLYHSCKFLPLIILYAAVSLRQLGYALELKPALATSAAVVLAGAVVFFLKPPSGKDHCSRALRYARQQNAGSAVVQFEHCVRSSPKYLRGYFHYGQFLMKMGERERAEAVYREARSIALDDSDRE